MALSDIEVFARLIQCEAGGEGEAGMKAVAGVVMNRTNIGYGEYSRVSNGGNIRNIIFQPGQFDCTRTTIGGRRNSQNIYNMSPEQIHFDIAQWAIAGNRLAGMGWALWFYNPYSASCRGNFPSQVGAFAFRVGNHCFYNPTDAYAQT